MDSTAEKTIGIFLFDDVEELDAVGPWEVLAFWTRTWPDDGWRVVTFSLDGAPVTAAKGMRMIPDGSVDDFGAIDVVLHPGGLGTRPLLADEKHLDRVRGWAEAAELTTSVCTGSLVYAAAGLLRNRPGHHLLGGARAAGRARSDDRGPAVRPLRRRRRRDHLVGGVRRHRHGALPGRPLVGEERAKATRRGIQYDPAPPV